MPPAVLPTPASVVARSLYLYESIGVGPGDGTPPAPEDVDARSLYLYVGHAIYGHPAGGETLGPDDVLARVLYLYVSIVHDRDPTDVPQRSLYLYAAYTNDEIFPWLMDRRPAEQFPGGEVSIYGDGFGADAAAEGGAVRLGVYDPAVPGPGQLMGIVSWQTRSPNLYPANSGLAIQPAIVVTVPADAVSGMLSIEETT